MITERTKLLEVERQLDWRVRSYPGKVAAGSLRGSDADWTIEVWRAIVADYRDKVEGDAARATEGTG